MAAKRAITRGTIQPKPLMLEFAYDSLLPPTSERKDKKEESNSSRMHPSITDNKNMILRFVRRDDKQEGQSVSMPSSERASTHRFFQRPR